MLEMSRCSDQQIFLRNLLKSECVLHPFYGFDKTEHISAEVNYLRNFVEITTVYFAPVWKVTE